MEGSSSSDGVAAAMDLAVQGPRRGRGAIDALVPLLSQWELLYLRSRIRDMNIHATRENGFTTCADLPVDILCIVVGYLSRHDLLNLRCVSREWGRVWMQDYTLRAVIHQHFPGLLQLHQGEKDLQRLFLDSMNRYRLRSQLECSSTIIPWDIDGALDRLPADGRSAFSLATSFVGRYIDNGCPPFLYHGGRVVWQPKPSEVVIDDLRAGQRIRCTPSEDPRRRRGFQQLVALSDKLIVQSAFSSPAGSYSLGCRLLKIYHFDERLWKSVTLPAGLAWCSAYETNVIACCNSGEALIWNWDGILEVLPTDHDMYNAKPSNTLHWREGIPGALFHPQSSHVVFLVWIYPHGPEVIPEPDSPYAGPNSLCTTVVVRYERGLDQGWIPSARFENTVNAPDINSMFADLTQSTSRLPKGSLILRCERADNHGSYSIVTCHDLAMKRSQSGPQWAWQNSVVQCFNVLTETFFHVSYHDVRPRPHTSESIQHLRGDTFQAEEHAKRVRHWNRQIFQMYELVVQGGSDDSRNHTSLQHGEVILTCDRIDVMGIHWTGATSGHTVTFDGYEADAFLRGPHELFVDDGFMVVTGGNGYFVHAFHDENTGSELRRSSGDLPAFIRNPRSPTWTGASGHVSIRQPQIPMFCHRTDVIELQKSFEWSE